MTVTAIGIAGGRETWTYSSTCGMQKEDGVVRMCLLACG